jgi:GNAT superfamily N-acetyltransferase
MRLQIQDFRDCDQTLRYDVVKALYTQWDKSYEKYARIYSEDDLMQFLDKQVIVFVFTLGKIPDKIEYPNKAAAKTQTLVATLTISNDANQPVLAGETYWISNLFVTEDYRNFGVGSAILKYAEEYIVGLNIKYIALTVENDNNRLWDYYKKRGYKPVGSYPISGNPIFLKIVG